MVAVKPVTDRYNLVLQGNIPLTTRMLLGNQQDNMKYVVDLLDALPNHNNLILSPGCDMPYATPVENVIATVEAIRDPKNTRQILAHYQASQMNLDAINLPDYISLENASDGSLHTRFLHLCRLQLYAQCSPARGQ